MFNDHPSTAAGHDVRRAAEELFSGGALSSKIEQALALGRMRGLDAFMTELPWKIAVQATAITGLSESMAAAVRDIHAQLVVMALTLHSRTVVLIEVDETRLPLPIQRMSGTRTREPR